jgi:hypothetical protein
MLSKENCLEYAFSFMHSLLGLLSKENPSLSDLTIDALEIVNHITDMYYDPKHAAMMGFKNEDDIKRAAEAFANRYFKN